MYISPKINVYCLSATIALALPINNVVHAGSARLADPASGHEYQRFDGPLSWFDAKNDCSIRGGHLVTVTSQAENSWVAANIGFDISWAGGTDEANEGTWRWITGENWEYANWGPGLLDDGGGGQDYMQIGPDGFWDDFGPPVAQPNAALSYICEWEGLPFNAFNTRAEFTLGLKPNDDSYWVRGWLKLADTSNGIDPLTESVTIKVGSFSHTIPGGSFVQEGGAYKYVGTVGQSKLDVAFWPQGKAGAYSFKSCVKNVNLADTTLQPEVELTVGDDAGRATLDLGYGKFGKGKDGQRWVLPPSK